MAMTSLSFLIYSCAAVSAPGGGPEDKTAPELISTTPEAGSLQFKGGKVAVSFSEYIDEKSIAKAVTIAPRLEPPVKIIYDDDGIILNFPENLLEDQTYVLTINRNLKDERQVALSQSIQVAFSTGDIIDKGIISGRVYGTEGYAVHLWKLAEGFTDSIFFTEPLYVAEADDKGNFEFKYLAPGDYVLLGLERAASGAKLVPQRMAYGVTPKQVYKLGVNETISNIPLRTRREIPPLKLTHGEWVGQKWGWMHFNQELDDPIIGDLTLIDANQKFFYPEFHQNVQDKKRFLLIAQDTLAPGKGELKLASAASGAQRLLGGTISFRVSEKIDTTHVKKVIPEGSESIRLTSDGGPKVSIVFSKPITEVKDSTFMMMVDSDTVITVVEWVNPTEIEFIPTKGWEEKTKYKLMIFSKGLIPIEGRSLKDSITFVTINSEKKMGYGGLTGFVKQNNIVPLVKLESMEKEPKFFHSAVNFDYQFQFNNIPEGSYRLIIIDDADKSNSFTYGYANPFQPSEWFYVHPDTFQVRANWDIDIGLIRIEEE